MIDVQAFQQKIFAFYQQNKREFVWRCDITPYKILISEVMLQQTQTVRVIPKFIAWMEKFPDIFSLAQASTYEVLSVWQGLGYNRRALFLHQAAQKIVSDYDGKIPSNQNDLQLLPGIGTNTAGSICAFAYDLPVVFVETNIRTVFLYEFFSERTEVQDSEIVSLIAETLPNEHFREWYYALMDYGVFLKINMKKNNRASAHYIKQSRFVGSVRQVRGAILKTLTQHRSLSLEELIDLVNVQLPKNHHDIYKIVKTMQKQKVLHCVDQFLQL